MRKRISSNIRIGKYLFIVLIVVVFYFIIKALNDKNVDIDSSNVAATTIIIFICVGLYFLFDSAKTVEYDSTFMYVIGKKGEEKVRLKDVLVIKYTMTEINKRNLWKIEYYNESMNEESVRILPKIFNNNFDEFKKLVKATNRNVVIQNWSSSFDFDQ